MAKQASDRSDACRQFLTLQIEWKPDQSYVAPSFLGLIALKTILQTPKEINFKEEINGKTRMSNIIPLFPAATDEVYEDQMLPALIEAMQLLQTTNHPDRDEVLYKISEALLPYTISSLETLERIRRSGYFDGNKLPEDVAHAIDNLAADYAEAMRGEDSRELANKLRTRQLTKTNWKLKW